MAMSSTSSDVSSEVVFEILSNRRRRMVLYYLRRHDGEATVNELAREIAALEDDVAVEDLTSQQQKRVYVSLYQTHLPKLDSTGMIEYDTEDGEVRLTERAVEMDSYLSPTAESDYPWELHYAALALLSAGLITLSFLDVSVFSAIPVYWIAIWITGMFVISTVTHYVLTRRREGRIPAELSDGNSR
jgi:DNA-binding transcriptional ArsR family regulator